MIDAQSGFAPLEWQNSPGMCEVLIGFENGDDFISEEWEKLYRFIMYLMNWWGEATNLCHKAISDPRYFQQMTKNGGPPDKRDLQDTLKEIENTLKIAKTS